MRTHEGPRGKELLGSIHEHGSPFPPKDVSTNWRNHPSSDSAPFVTNGHLTCVTRTTRSPIGGHFVLFGMLTLPY